MMVLFIFLFTTLGIMLINILLNIEVIKVKNRLMKKFILIISTMMILFLSVVGMNLYSDYKIIQKIKQYNCIIDDITTIVTCENGFNAIDNNDNLLNLFEMVILKSK